MQEIVDFLNDEIEDFQYKGNTIGHQFVNQHVGYEHPSPHHGHHNNSPARP